MNSRYVLQLTDGHSYAARFDRRPQGWVRAALHEYPCGFASLPREASDLTALGRELGTHVSRDFSGEVVCRLVIPAGWCFVHCVELAMDCRNTEAAVFEFEHCVPVDLERLTCTVSRLSKSQAMIAAVFTEPLLGFLKELEHQHVLVEAIYVDALLLNGRRTGAENDDLEGVILLHDQHLTLVAAGPIEDAATYLRTMGLRPGLDHRAIGERLIRETATTSTVPPRWHLLSLVPGNGVGELRQIAAGAGADLRVTGASAAVDTLLHAAATEEHEVDLRRGKLNFAGRWSGVRSCTRRLAAVVATLLLVLVIRLQVERTTYAHGRNELLPLRNEIYAGVFPGHATPPEAALRLQSERIRLEGLTSGGAGIAGPMGHNGLDILHLLREVADGIPPDVKLDVTEILADGEGLRISGRTTSHGAAGSLVRMLNTTSGLSAEPPRTKLRQDGTVDFTINTRRADGADDAQAALLTD